MKKLMTAVALTIALPAAAFAQATAPADPHAGHNMAATSGQAKHDCKAMNQTGMNHSKMDHSKMAGMDHSKMSGMSMPGMEPCAKPAATADKAKPSSTQNR